MAFTNVNLQTAANKVYLLATGKPTGIDITTTKGQRIVQLLNFFQGDWASDRSTDWHSLRQIFTVPSVVSATDTYNIASLFTGSQLHHISRQEGDFVRIFGTDGVSEWDYTIVEPSGLYASGPQLNNSGNPTYNAVGTVAIVGQTLVFSHQFLSTDPQIGGTIKFPGYIVPNDMSLTTDFLSVDDPEWLETRAAAEYVRNDITRVQLYPSLMDVANDKLADMRAVNEAQLEQAYTTPFILGQTW